MTTLAELCARRPQAGHGAPLTYAHVGDYFDLMDWDSGVYDVAIEPRIAIEMAVPSGSSPALWGQAIWGSSTWSTVEWKDITPYVRGVEWERGGEPGERPRIGVWTLELDNEGHIFSPWSPNPFTSPSYFAPGTLIRIACHDSGSSDWWPQITCVVESWIESDFEVGADPIVTVTSLETATLLARVDEFAGATEGSGDTPAQRMERLLDAADWAFGHASDTARTTTMQSTQMAGNRITELYLLADSIDGVFRTARQGHVILIDKESSTAAYPWEGGFVISHLDGLIGDVMHIPYNADSLRVSNDDAATINVANLAAAGGTQYNYVDTVSAARYGRRSYTRNDLIYRTSEEPAASEWIGDRMLARSETYRPASVTLDALQGPHVLRLLLDLDIGHVVTVHAPGRIFTDYAVSKLAHRMTPSKGEWLWQCDVTFETTTTSAWEAAA